MIASGRIYASLLMAIVATVLCHGFRTGSVDRRHHQLSFTRRLEPLGVSTLAANGNSYHDGYPSSSSSCSLSRPFLQSNLAEALEKEASRLSCRFQSAERLEKLPIAQLAERLDRDLYKSQWFVTGQVDPKYFCLDFTYEDADIQLNSLEAYVDDVHALFDQKMCRADIISTKVSQEQPNVITCEWRLSGRANFGPWGMHIKPCVIHTYFTINPESGLIQHQEDRYSIRHWDLFLSAIFPNSAGVFTAATAPPVPDRIETPSEIKVLPVEAWTSRSGIQSYFGSSPPKDNIVLGAYKAAQVSTIQRARPSQDSLKAEMTEELDKSIASSSELLAYSDVSIMDIAQRRKDVPSSLDSRRARRAELKESLNSAALRWRRQKSVQFAGHSNNRNSTVGGF